MDTGARGLLMRWALLCALLLGVVGMHHVATEMPSHADMPSMSMQTDGPAVQDQPTPGHDAQHDLLHLCLAVLGAALLLLVFSALRHLLPVARRLGRGTAGAQPARPPPILFGRSLLSSLCVLRQ